MCGDQAINSIDKFISLGYESFKTLYKVLLRPGGVTETHALEPGFKINARAYIDLMLAVYFINHQYRFSRYITFINLMFAGVRKLASLFEMEEDATEGYVTTPTVHNKYFPKTLEVVEEYLCMFHGVNGTALSYVVRKQHVHTDEADDPSNGYYTINGDIISRSPIVVSVTVSTTVDLEANDPFATSYLTDKATFLGNLNSTFVDSAAWTYFKVGKRQHNFSNRYLAFYDHFLVPNNVDHMGSAAEKILQNTLYHRERNNNTF